MKHPTKIQTSIQPPAVLGYRMPAEWEHHEATWLAWPHNPETWSRLSDIESIFADMISVLIQGETVKLLVNDSREEEKVKKFLSKCGIQLSKIVFFQIKTWDAWIRDYGANVIVKKSARAANRWIFNAWGSKYEEHCVDDQASKEIMKTLKLDVFEPNLVLEGGSIDTNGAGIVLTTEECLLNSNRNPNLNQKEIETRLKNYLGVKQVIWLGKGIEGDDTDGHVDDIARFVNENTIVVVSEKNRRDTNYEPLAENLKRLRNARDAQGRPINIIELPMPKPVLIDSHRLPASYANFYISNTAVLVPTFNQASDKSTIQIFRELFPKRSVVGIRSEALVEGLGSIHCLTHEEPAAP